MSEGILALTGRLVYERGIAEGRRLEREETQRLIKEVRLADEQLAMEQDKVARLQIHIEKLETERGRSGGDQTSS